MNTKEIKAELIYDGAYINIAWHNKVVADLKCEIIALKAERDALRKSVAIPTKPIEVIQPKGLVE